MQTDYFLYNILVSSKDIKVYWNELIENIRVENK